MPVDVTATLREALSKLTTEKRRIERQTVAIQDAIRAVNGASSDQSSKNDRIVTRRAKRRSRRMSPAARKAISARMKVYWAKRKGGASKTKRKTA
jgi:hypothetical protein